MVKKASVKRRVHFNNELASKKERNRRQGISMLSKQSKFFQNKRDLGFHAEGKTTERKGIKA
jgi:hypothetical protein